MRSWTQICFSLFLLVWCSESNAAGPNFTRQDQVLANILLELPHYVSIPEGADKGSLCLVAHAPLSEALRDANAKRKSYSAIIMTSEPNLGNCSYVYVSDKRSARRILRNMALSHVFVISNYGSFINEGGPIAIVDNEGEVEIFLNLTSARKHHLTFSPDLIELSKRVVQ